MKKKIILIETLEKHNVPVCVLDDGRGVTSEEVLDGVPVRGVDLLALPVVVHPEKKTRIEFTFIDLSFHVVLAIII